MIAAAISRMLKFEPEMRKTVVWGASELDTERSSSRHVSTNGGKADGDIEKSWRSNQEFIQRRPVKLMACTAGECRRDGARGVC